MAGIDCCEAPVPGRSDHRAHLVAGWGIDVHGRSCVLRMEEDSLQPRYLASVRDGGQYLSLLCSGLLGDPASQGLNSSPFLLGPSDFTFEPSVTFREARFSGVGYQNLIIAAGCSG